MAGRKSKKVKKLKSVYLLEACQVDHVFGIYENLNQAHCAACKMIEPDSDFDEVKEIMPLYSYEDSENGKPYYYIWDEAIAKYSWDEPVFHISEIELGKSYKYSSKDNNVLTRNRTLKVIADDFGQIATASKEPDCYWAFESNKDGVVFNTFIEEQFDSETLAQIAEDLEFMSTKANEKYEKVISSVGAAMPSDISQAYWQYWTYNPELSEEELVDIISEFV